MIRNQPNQKFHVIAFDKDGRVSGAANNITCSLSIDGGTRNLLNDTTPIEIDNTGEYTFDLLQNETDGYSLSFAPVCNLSGVQVLGTPSNVIFTTNNDSSGVTTLLSRITGLIRTKSEDDSSDSVITGEIDNIKQKLDSKENEVKSY